MNIHKYKEQDPVSSRLEIKVEEKPERPRVERVESRTAKAKDGKEAKKREEQMATLPMSTKNVNGVIKKGIFTFK